MYKVLLILLLIPSITFGQWDQHAHFGISATLTFSLHFKLGKQETFQYPAMVLSLGGLKETFDLLTTGHWSWLDIRQDVGGVVTGFVISDMIKRKQNKHKLLESYN